jgi:hypothetical protein
MTKTLKDCTHKDILGNSISVGDIVAYPSHNHMKIGVVKKLNPKMINVIAVGKNWIDRKYPSELLVVNDPKISFYVLKNAK